MNTLDELITAVLHEEAEDAPSTDAFVSRVLRDHREVPSRPDRRHWAVPVVVAAVTALIVSAAVASSLAGSSKDDEGPTNPGPTPATSTPKTGAEIPPGHEGRLPGWIALSSGSVHVEMNATTPVIASRKVWRIDCPDAALSTLESGDVACAGEDGETPLYEVMVAPGLSPDDVTTPNVRWDAPLRKVPTTPAQPALIGGTPVILMTTSGDVRYGCPESCRRWVVRNLTVIAFPDQGRHVTILGPADRHATVNAFGGITGNLGWLTNYIYLDLAD